MTPWASGAWYIVESASRTLVAPRPHRRSCRVYTSWGTNTRRDTKVSPAKGRIDEVSSCPWRTVVAAPCLRTCGQGASGAWRADSATCRPPAAQRCHFYYWSPSETIFAIKRVNIPILAKNSLPPTAWPTCLGERISSLVPNAIESTALLLRSAAPASSQFSFCQMSSIAFAVQW